MSKLKHRACAFHPACDMAHTSRAFASSHPALLRPFSSMMAAQTAHAPHKTSPTGRQLVVDAASASHGGKDGWETQESLVASLAGGDRILGRARGDRRRARDSGGDGL
ncbi:hypothetical protein PCAR4_240025 [Paraburkholderia caribensis]|nr:hypothetical protein PCAR4_240025 [Paraburkholderia caribensis]